MKAKYGTSCIFLASDSKAVILEAKKYEGEFRFLTVDGHHKSPARGKLTWDELAKQKVYSIDPTSIARKIITIMHLLGSCDMLVGKFTSNVFRIGFQLNVARTACVPPYVSLDSPWCFDWAISAGRSGKGRHHRFHC